MIKQLRNGEEMITTSLQAFRVYLEVPKTVPPGLQQTTNPFLVSFNSADAWLCGADTIDNANLVSVTRLQALAELAWNDLESDEGKKVGRFVWDRRHSKPDNAALCLHEVLDRAHVVSCIYNEHVLDHQQVQLNQELRTRANQISDLLADFYQRVGNIIGQKEDEDAEEDYDDDE